MNAVHDLRLYKQKQKLSVADKIVMHQVDNKPPTQTFLGLSFSKAFVRQDCVTSQTNVCVDGQWTMGKRVLTSHRSPTS